MELKTMYRLDKNELPFSLPSQLRERIRKALDAVETNRYPDPTYTELKTALASRFGLKPSNVVTGNGGDELLWLSFASFARQDRPVFFLKPSFSEYERLSGVFNVSHVSSTIQIAENISFDMAGCISALRTHTPSLVLIDSPNNPTGNSLPPQMLDEIFEWTQSNDSILLLDEAYGEFAEHRYSDRFLDTGIPPRTIVLKTLSKAWGFAGCRLGYVLCPPEIAGILDGIRSPFNINAFSAAAALELLRYPEIMERNVGEIRSRRDSFTQRMNSLSGWRAFPSDTNFVLLARQPVIPDFHRISASAGFRLKIVFPENRNRTWIRVSIGTEWEMEALFSFFSTL